MTKALTLLIIAIIGHCAAAQSAPPFNPADNSTFTATRSDSLFVSSRAIAHKLMQARPPRLRFTPGLSPEAHQAWRGDVAQAMKAMMKHPPMPGKIEARRTGSHQRDGYTLERWEIYPLPEAAVPFVVLIPDGVDSAKPAPAILCIPGHGQTKELLCGETAIDPEVSKTEPGKNAMAYHYVKEGYIAVAVDNPGCGEPADLENLTNAWPPDYVTLSRALLELDWSYLGYTSFLDRVVLEWMKTQPAMRSDRLVVSGFSLGTEPLMVLGALDPDIYAFVYNDFLCTTRERALVMTLPDDKGRRPWPNDISHLIPGFLCEFDFPDLVAALAPRPVICTEGGLDRDFDLVKASYAIAGAPEAFTAHHYAKFADPAARQDITVMPEGINRDTFFRLANVDPPNHYFKAEHILPWLKKILLP